MVESDRILGAETPSVRRSLGLSLETEALEGFGMQRCGEHHHREACSREGAEAASCWMLGPVLTRSEDLREPNYTELEFTPDQRGLS